MRTEFKKLLVFVNFIEASKKAIKQALFLSGENTKLTICHVVKEGKPNDSEKIDEIKTYFKDELSGAMNIEFIVESGSLFDTLSKVATKVQPDLVVAGTRGVEGFDIGLHGSAIYKFVREVRFTTLVIHLDSVLVENGFSKVMLPISNHPNFMKKVHEAVRLLHDEGEVIVLVVNKEGDETDEKISINLKETEQYLDNANYKWSYRNVTTKRYDHNYAQHAIREMKENGIDLISIAADVSPYSRHFGKMQKEDILLNDAGVPVLCTNTDLEE